MPSDLFGVRFRTFPTKEKKISEIFLNNFIKIDFSKNSHDSFFVDLFNLNNVSNDIFWEINILGVIERVHFS